MRRLFYVLMAVMMAAPPAQARSPAVRGASIVLDQTGVNIASNMKVPGYNGTGLSNNSYTSQNSESFHYNESGQSITSLALIYSGWYTDSPSNTGAEVNSPNPFTVTASIEYPYGTYNQVTFNKSNSDLIPPGANIVSDRVTLSTPIPAGAEFWIRTYVSVPNAGYQWPTTYGTQSGELCENGTSLADKTMGGTITNNASVTCLKPSAAISKITLKVSYACLGDSIMAGAGDGGIDTHGNIGWCNRAASGVVPEIGMAVTGTTLAQQVVSGVFTRRPDLMKKAGITHAMCNWAINDERTGTATSTVLEANIVTVATAIVNAGPKAYWTTTTPNTTTTNGYYTIAGQTKNTWDGTRVTVNNWIRGTPSPLTGFIENAWAMESSHDSGYFGSGSTFNSSLAPIDSLVVAAGSTSTVIKTNSVRAANFYGSGELTLTSGAANGLASTISSSDASGNITLSTALATVPSAGDTVSVAQYGAQQTNDGIHPNNATSVYGGQSVLIANLTPYIQYWQTH